MPLPTVVLRRLVSAGTALSALSALLAATAAAAAPQPLRFVLIPKVSHLWYDVVREGAEAAGAMIRQQTGRLTQIDYQPPARSEVELQAEILKEAIRSRPSGIMIDLLDAPRLRPLLEQARRQGIPVNLFDSEPPDGLPLTSIGNDFCKQARIASQRLVERLGGKGEVAIMQGVPTAPNHAIRVRCHQEVFARHPGIKVVATPIDQDSIAIAQQQALATMRLHPQLRGWVVADAGGGIGIGRALQTLGRAGQVQVVGIDDLPEMMQLIRAGVVDSTSATKPRAQGYWSILNLWQQGLSAPTIERIDTGIVVEGPASRGG
jgi:ribose transport system substrate-binding protein